MNHFTKLSALFLTLVVLLFSALPATAASAPVKFATGKSGDTYMYLPDSIKQLKENVACVAYVRNIADPQDETRRKLFMLAVNLQERQFAVLASADYSADGKQIAESKNAQPAWHRIESGSILEPLVQIIVQRLNAAPAPSGDRQSTTHGVKTGSGFFITPSLAVTNYHVINGASQIQAIYHNDTKVSASVVAVDKANDLALLRIAGLENSVTPLALGNSSDVKEGARVYAIGFPLSSVIGNTAKITEGLISSTSGLGGNLSQFQISAPIQPGNSGGPLLNEQGQVVGVVTSSLSKSFSDQAGFNTQNVNFAMKSINIRNLAGNRGFDIPVAGNSRTLNGVEVMEKTKKALVYLIVE